MATYDMDALEEQGAALFERRDGFNKERETRRKERDHLNESVKELQAKARNAKAERDGVNTRVAELKGRLGGLRERLEAKRETAGEIYDENDESRRGLRPRWRLLDEIREIEWELSTTPTLDIKDREAELIERAKHLKVQVEEHRKLDTRDDMYLMSLADSNAVGMEIRKIREEMDALRETGQEHHERMLAFYRHADEESKRSDEAHKKFVEVLEALREVNGELDKATVKESILEQQAGIDECYQRAYQRNSKIKGEVTVSFTISPTGNIFKAQIAKSTLGDKPLEACIEKSILSWRFPMPKSGIVRVRYPFVLRPR